MTESVSSNTVEQLQQYLADRSGLTVNKDLKIDDLKVRFCFEKSGVNNYIMDVYEGHVSHMRFEELKQQLEKAHWLTVLEQAGSKYVPVFQDGRFARSELPAT